MTKKKVILASAVLLAIGAVGYGGSSAYFSDYDNKPNTVTVGHNDTTIEEEFPDPTPKPVEDNPSYPKRSGLRTMEMEKRLLTVTSGRK